MAVTETRLHQISMLLAANGTVIGGADGVTMDATLDTETITPATKDLWPHLATLTQRGTFSIGRVQYLESADRILGSTGTFTFNSVEVKGWQTATFATTLSPVEVTDVNDAGVAAYIPGARTNMTITLRGNYYDHEATLGAGHKELYTRAAAKTTHTSILTFGAAQSYSVVTRVSSYKVIPGSGNVQAQFEAVLVCSGAVTPVTTNIDSGFGALVDACFASTPSAITALLHHSVDHTQFSASTYATRCDITVPANGTVTAAMELVMNGALTVSVETT